MFKIPMWMNLLVHLRKISSEGSFSCHHCRKRSFISHNWPQKPYPCMGRFLFFGKSRLSEQRSRKPSHQLSFALFFVKLTPLAFSVSASFSAFFFSNSACLQFSSCAFRNNLIKFNRVAVTAMNKPATKTS
jgi:hypothetical protein